VTVEQIPSNCREIDRQFRRMIRRIHGGNSASDLAGIPADSRWQSGVITAG
jgi:hypothetical protein